MQRQATDPFYQSRLFFFFRTYIFSIKFYEGTAASMHRFTIPNDSMNMYAALYAHEKCEEVLFHEIQV